MEPALYRAKDVDTHQWVYGNYVDRVTGCVPLIITSAEMTDECDVDFDYHFVDGTTVEIVRKRDNGPLTETALMQMVGQPIWIMPTANAPDRLDWDPAWVIMREDYVFVYSKSHESRAYIRFVKDYGKTWIAYRNPPEGDDSL